jgi:acyl-CoA thioesterase-2
MNSLAETADLRVKNSLVTPNLTDLLTLERIDRDLYRTPPASHFTTRLFGGVTAAQALAAAGATVDPDRLAHSLHGYFLRGGDAAAPTVFRVERDRDGRSFSARRVVAVQDGKVIFNMSASFQLSREGIDQQADPVPAVEGPDGLPPFKVGLPAFSSLEARLPAQPFPESQLPTRLWFKSREKLSDEPLAHACVLTYMSDTLSVMAAFDPPSWRGAATLDHAVWFHRQVRADEWVLMDLNPHSAAGGRGWYTGTLHSADGILGASLAQEEVFMDRW